MEKIISCCGVICSECSSYPEECPGCPNIKGKVYWLEYTGEDICDIYNCCVLTKKYTHCGQCTELPCTRYDNTDPTKSQQENDADFEKQIKTLSQLAKKQD